MFGYLLLLVGGGPLSPTHLVVCAHVYPISNMTNIFCGPFPLAAVGLLRRQVDNAPLN